MQPTLTQQTIRKTISSSQHLQLLDFFGALSLWARRTLSFFGATAESTKKTAE
jgi:hypothetical protein